MRFRLAVIVPTYLVLFVVCYHAAFLLRFDFNIPPEFRTRLYTTLGLVLVIKLMVCVATREWWRTYRYATMRDVYWIAFGSALAAVAMGLMNLLPLPNRFFIPRSVIGIDWALSMVACLGVRTAMRGYRETLRTWFLNEEKDTFRTMVYGADENAINIVRGLGQYDHGYQIVGFVAPCGADRKSLLIGLPTHLETYGWKELAARFDATHLLVPTTISGHTLRAIRNGCAQAGVTVHLVPGVEDLVTGKYKLSISEVTIADLLRREPNQLDLQSIRGYISNQSVLVTGGAGSIGSELCRQLLVLQPRLLVIVDQSELGVFTIQQEFKARAESDCELRFIVTDITDPVSLQRVMKTHAPDLVFHAAAYKHVPLMEESPQEAIRNNILGSKTVIDVAVDAQVKRFVMISTDKAVRPTSVMGATKLIAEKYLQAKARVANTRFITVRFGNVLNSAGSVIPTFRQQIETGGPVTVTHPDMIRFFMTIPEAVQLVLQAGAIGNSGDILILDMGKPVKILDLAKDMISLSGLNYPDEIDIHFTGVRPGEKLYEELFYDTEEDARQVHEKIYRASPQPIELTRVMQQLQHLEATLQSEPQDALDTLWNIVADYLRDDEQRTNIRPAA